MAETAKYLAPFGDIGDVVPIYQMRAKQYMRNQVAEMFMRDYLGIEPVKKGILPQPVPRPVFQPAT